MKRMMNLFDGLLLFAALLAAALLLWHQYARPGEAAARADVYESGNLFESRTLSEDSLIEINGVVIEISGGARVISSTCPDQRCVKRGKILRAGESIVCLPNRVSIMLAGEEALDAVLY